MKARAVRFDHFGGTDVLQLQDVDVTATHGRVVVRVSATAVNPGEATIRSGAMQEVFPTTFPTGEGTDLAGTVVEVGDGVSRVAVGDEVLGWTWERAAHATHVAVPQEQLVPKPAGVSWEAAGSLAVAGTTAWACVAAVGAHEGDVVGVSAAAGGVGSLVVQLLRERGATVLAIASPDNHEWLRSLGAVPVAYGEGLEDRLREAAEGAGRPVDAFIDCFGPEYVQLALHLGVEPDRINTIIAFDAAHRHGTKAEGSADATTQEVLTELAARVADGRLVVPVARTFDLDEVREAFDVLEQRHVRGKVVLLPTS